MRFRPAKRQHEKAPSPSTTGDPGLFRDFLAAFEAELQADWSHLGTQVTASGARCIGHVPHVGSAAWLHRIHPGIWESTVLLIEERTHRSIPVPARALLDVANGASIFVSALRMFGELDSGLMRRDVNDPGPLSLIQANNVWRPRGKAVGREDYSIGASSIGNGSTYMVRPDATVTRVATKGGALEDEWAGITSMLESEYARLHPRYDSDGRKIAVT